MTDIHDQGRGPGKDVQDGDDGTQEAPSSSSFTKEFKAEVVALVRQPGNTVASVARELDLTETAVREWAKQADIDDGHRDGVSTSDREELARLRRENQRLRQDVEILKRATAFFAKETR